MNFSYEQLQFIQNALERDDIGQLLPQIMKEYCKGDLEKTRDYLKYINILIDEVMSINNKVLTGKSQALFWSVCLNSRIDKKIYKPSVPEIIKIAMEIFPEGYCSDRACQAEKEFYKLFIDSIKEKRSFDYKRESDLKWAEQYGYIDYITKVLKTMES